MLKHGDDGVIIMYCLYEQVMSFFYSLPSRHSENTKSERKKENFYNKT